MGKEVRNTNLLRVTVGEQLVKSKTDRAEDCEDLIHISESFVAVIDGLTSKTDRRWNGETGGRKAAKTIGKAFEMMPPECTAREAVDLMTKMIQNQYKGVDPTDILETDPKQRMGAFFAAISLSRREVWVIGDCQVLLGGQMVTNRKLADQVLADVRALKLELEILKGVTIDQLRQNDTGRDFIWPLLEEQSMLQNNPAAGKYWYPIVDGCPVPDEGIIVKPIPDNIESVVLATDGYPILKDNLKESEEALQEILREDSLLFRSHKSTKGITKGNVSFDDRAFIRVTLDL